jgi:putative permease
LTKKLATVASAVIVTLLALALVWQLRTAVIYVLVSLALAAALRPVTRLWARRRWLARIGLLALYLVALGSIGLLLVMAGGTAVSEIQQLAANTAAQDSWKMPLWLQGSAFQQALAVVLPAPSSIFKSITGEKGQLVLPTLVSVSYGIEEIVAGVLLVVVLSVYWSVHHIHFERLWLSLLPPRRRRQVRTIWRAIEPEIGAYVRGQMIVSLLAGLTLALGYWALGSPYPTLLGVAGALAWLIPVVGAAMAVIVSLTVGLLTGLPMSLLSAAYTALVFMALILWIKPHLVTRLQDNPFLTVAILLVMAQALGLPGIIIAPPLSMVCQILWRHLVSQQDRNGAAARISDLRDRQARVRDNILAMEQPPLALVTSSMQQLGQLMKKAEPILKAAAPADPAQ